MIIYILVIFFTLYHIDKIRKMRSNTLQLKCKYELFKIRDELREAALEGEIDRDNWAFQYLDSSIVRFIEKLPLLNIYKVFVLFIEHKNDLRIKNAIQTLENEMRKKENRKLKEIQEIYISRLGMYFLDKHFLLRFIIIFGFIVPSKIKIYLDGKWKKLIDRTAEFPETSTILNYT